MVRYLNQMSDPRLPTLCFSGPFFLHRPLVGYANYAEYSLLDKKVLVPLCGHLQAASPFSFEKIQNLNPKPGYDLVQTRNPGLEKDIWVWNP